MSVAETGAAPAASDGIARVREILAAKPDSVLEFVARETGVPTLAVLEETAPEGRRRIDGAEFEAVWREIASWGDILFLVHTPTMVLEIAGPLPIGSFGHGYYNIHGDSPIGGHLKADRCRTIYLVDRRSGAKRTCSVQFFDEAGEAMFKIFVRRDKERQLLPEQTSAFEALWARQG